MFSIWKTKKYILLMFQKIIQIVKNQIIVLIIPNREKWHYPAVWKLSALLRGITAIDNSKK